MHRAANMATHNHERRAALEKKRNAAEATKLEKDRKRNNRITQAASGEQTNPKVSTKRKRADNADERKKTGIASRPQNIQENATKRKRAAYTDQLPRKKGANRERRRRRKSLSALPRARECHRRSAEEDRSRIANHSEKCHQKEASHTDR